MYSDAVKNFQNIPNRATRVGIIMGGDFYNWSKVYKLCGLCSEDFLWDSEGSWKHFEECFNNFEGNGK